MLPTKSSTSIVRLKGNQNCCHVDGVTGVNVNDQLRQLRTGVETSLIKDHFWVEIRTVLN